MRTNPAGSQRRCAHAMRWSWILVRWLSDLVLGIGSNLLPTVMSPEGILRVRDVVGAKGAKPKNLPPKPKKLQKVTPDTEPDAESTGSFSAKSTRSTTSADRLAFDRRYAHARPKCAFTGNSIIQKAHVLPHRLGQEPTSRWSELQSLRGFSSIRTDSARNRIHMQANLHVLYDLNCFALLPVRQYPTQPTPFVLWLTKLQVRSPHESQLMRFRDTRTRVWCIFSFDS